MVKKHLFGHISASENILWMKISQNDCEAEAIEHTKFDGHLCRHKMGCKRLRTSDSYRINTFGAIRLKFDVQVA